MFFLSAFLLAGIAVVFLVWLGTFIWQIFLSKADNPWLGLILPGVTFGVTLYICRYAPDSYTLWLLLTSGGVPTAVYLLTYFIVRIVRKRKKKR